LLGWIFTLDGYLENQHEKLNECFKNHVNKVIVPLLLSVIGLILLPTEKEIAFIYLTPKIVNNKQIQEVPKNALKILNKKMESYINELDAQK